NRPRLHEVTLKTFHNPSVQFASAKELIAILPGINGERLAILEEVVILQRHALKRHFVGSLRRCALRPGTQVEFGDAVYRSWQVPPLSQSRARRQQPRGQSRRD